MTFRNFLHAGLKRAMDCMDKYPNVYEPGNLKCIYTLIKKHVIAKKHMKANNNSN